MADAVARTGKIQAVFFAHALDIPVVVGVFKAGLQGIMVDIGHRTFGFYPGHTHGLEFQIRHRPGGVLGQRLVDFQPDFAARRHLAVQQVGLDELLCECVAHAEFLLISSSIPYYDGLFKICQSGNFIQSFVESRRKP